MRERERERACTISMLVALCFVSPFCLLIEDKCVAKSPLVHMISVKLIEKRNHCFLDVGLRCFIFSGSLTQFN